MSDLFGTNGAALAMGNARRQQVRDLNDRIKEHNDSVLNTIQGLKDQAASAAQFKEIQDQAVNLWSAKDIPGKVQAYNEWKAARNAPNPIYNQIQTSRGNVDKTTGRLVDDAGESTSSLAAPVAETAPAGESAGKVASGIEDTVKGGLKNAGVEESLVGKIGSKVGVLGSAALGGMDVYEDIQDSIKSGHLTIAGNNNWEKASNLLQIGGTAADLVGTFFPPARLLGGVLDIASGVTDSVGEKLDETKKASDLDVEAQKETEAPVSVATSQSVAFGRTE